MNLKLFIQPPEDVAKEGVVDGEGEDEISEPIPTTPEPKEWIPLGSEQEIFDNTVKATRSFVSEI